MFPLTEVPPHHRSNSRQPVSSKISDIEVFAECQPPNRVLFHGFQINDIVLENALEFLGRLIVCARQLDATLKNDTAIKLYANYFINEKFEMFV